MAPPSFRLDHLAVLYIARLEATRRAHDTPAATTEALRRATAELVAAQARECREMLGDLPQAALIEKEGMDTFLPRYTRLALEQNREEARVYGALPGGPAGRVVVTVATFVLASVLARVFPGRIDLAFYALPFVALFWPELRTWSTRRRYERALQELADDLGQLQDAAERLAVVADPLVTASPAPASPMVDAESHRAPPGQKIG